MMWVAGLGGCVAASSDTDPIDLEPSGTASSSDDAGSSESGTGDPVGGGNCVETPSVLTDVDAVGITGRSAAELLADVEGTYTGAITWSAEGPAHYVGSTSPSSITMTLGYDGGEIRSIDAELASACEHDGPCPCEDSFEIDVTWRLTSADGVLDETWTAAVIHQPGSWFMGSELGIRHDFQPDDAAGDLSAASFALEDGAVIRRLEASAELGNGAASGSIAVELEHLGGIGFGPIAGFGGVRAVDDDACNALSGTDVCVAAGCSAVDGQSVYGAAPDCSCADAQSYCFASTSEPDGPKTLYTRPVGEGVDAWHEVVALPQLSDPPPAPWRACTDAPEIPECACFEAELACG